MDFLGFVEQLVDWVWGTPLIVMVLGSGVFFTLVSGCFQFRYGRYIFKNTVGRIFSGKVDDGPGLLSPYEAVSVAIGSTVGVGNIGGVATAIAVGGPGAVFWMWMAGIFGQLIKMVEVTLAVHYRTVLDDGQSTYGGPTYYIQRGLGQERGWHGLAKVLSGLFLIGFLICYFFTIQNYTVAEAVAGVFDVNLLLVSFVFLVLLYASIWGGIRGLGKIAVAVVPFMCLFYIGGALVVILKGRRRHTSYLRTYIRECLHRNRSGRWLCGSCIREDDLRRNGQGGLQQRGWLGLLSHDPRLRQGQSSCEAGHYGNLRGVHGHAGDMLRYCLDDHKLR